MATPPWWDELVGVSEVLADADRAEIESWRGPDAQDASDESAFSIRTCMRALYWSPTYRLPADREDVLVAEVLKTLVGDDGYVHKLHVAYRTTADGQSVSGELTMTLSNWGSDVSIDVPDDDEALDATQLLGALGAKP